MKRYRGAFGASVLVLIACGGGPGSGANGQDGSSASSSGAMGSGGSTSNAGSSSSAMTIGDEVGPSSSLSATGVTSSSVGSTGSGSTRISLVVNPAIAHVAPSATATFKATLTGTSDSAVTWTVQEGTMGGSIDARGLYTSPAATGTYHVVATSRADASATGTASVIVGVAKPCSALPAPGTWEPISPVAGGQSDAVIVDPFDASTVWASVKNGGIFKSLDCGATWTHVNTGMNGSMVDMGDPLSVVVDPVDHGVMYTNAAGGSEGIWKSTNGGVDWAQLFPPDSEVATHVQYNLANSTGMDIHDTHHLVVSMHAACLAPYGPVCVAESMDAGSTWKITTVPIPRATDWIAGAGAFVLDASSWLFTTYSAGLWLTKDHGATYTNVTAPGAWGSTSGKTIILPFAPTPSGTYYLGDMQGVIESKDGETWSLLPNSGGTAVGLVSGDGNLYSSNQWAPSYHTAKEGDPTWSVVPPPPGLAADQGGPYLAYDTAHHLLYSSNWLGGLWRMVTQ